MSERIKTKRVEPARQQTEYVRIMCMSCKNNSWRCPECGGRGTKLVPKGKGHVGKYGTVYTSKGVKSYDC